MAFALIALAAFAVFVVMAVAMNPSALSAAATAVSRPTSPVDEAERILARRYVRGELDAQEYERMLAVLRR